MPSMSGTCLRKTAHRSQKMDLPSLPDVTKEERTQRLKSLIHRLGLLMLMGLKLAATLGTQLICALIISQYSASHSGHGKERIAELLGLCIRAYWSVSPLFPFFVRLVSLIFSIQSPLRIAQFSVPKSADNLSLPKFIVDPSASTFINAVMLYLSAVLLSYNMGGHSRHQDRFLAFGALSGILLGVTLLWSGSGLEALKDSIPISITTALALSQIWYAIQSLIWSIS